MIRITRSHIILQGSDLNVYVSLVYLPWVTSSHVILQTTLRSEHGTLDVLISMVISLFAQVDWMEIWNINHQKTFWSINVMVMYHWCQGGFIWFFAEKKSIKYNGLSFVDRLYTLFTKTVTEMVLTDSVPCPFCIHHILSDWHRYWCCRQSESLNHLPLRWCSPRELVWIYMQLIILVTF